MDNRYFQAGWAAAGHANGSRARFEFVADVKNCPVGRVGYPGRPPWPDLRLAASSRPVGERGHPGPGRGAERKQWPDGGASDHRQEPCRTVLHGKGILAGKSRKVKRGRRT